ncbi:hypothetical protein ES703_48924 [subsurface metagenome]
MLNSAPATADIHPHRDSARPSMPGRKQPTPHNVDPTPGHEYSRKTPYPLPPGGKVLPMPCALAQASKRRTLESVPIRSMDQGP